MCLYKLCSILSCNLDSGNLYFFTTHISLIKLFGVKSAFILLFVYVLHKTLSAVVPTEKGIWRNLQKKKLFSPQ